MNILFFLNLKYDALLLEKARKYIAFAIDGAKRMRIIIPNLLEFSCVGSLETSLKAVDIITFVCRIEALLLKEIKEKQSKIHCIFFKSIESHALPLHQVFQNLIGNALKYCHPTKAPIVSVSGKDIGQYRQFEITDNGILKQNIMRRYLIFFNAYIIKKNTQVQALG